MFQNRSVQLIVTGLAALWILLSTIFFPTAEAQVMTAAMEGFRAPDFEARDRAGNLVSLTQFRGQVVLLNLWASWCQPCRAEMPAMESTYQSLRDKGFVVLAVNMTSQDSQDDAIAFSDQLGLTFPILFDPEGVVEQRYRLQALPTSFFIGRDGIIHSIVVGGPMPGGLIYSKAIELLEEGQ